MLCIQYTTLQTTPPPLSPINTYISVKSHQIVLFLFNFIFVEEDEDSVVMKVPEIYWSQTTDSIKISARFNTLRYKNALGIRGVSPLFKIFCEGTP